LANDNRAAFRSFVCQARQLRGVGELFVGDSVQWHESRRLPVAQRDGAGLVEQQRVDVPCGFHGPPGHGQHVALHQPVHAGDPDGAQQSTDRRGDEADQ
jgi:hypothetical protein